MKYRIFTQHMTEKCERRLFEAKNDKDALAVYRKYKKECGLYYPHLERIDVSQMEVVTFLE